jgi:hypothetical protein
MSLEESAIIASDILGMVENYQWELGRITSHIVETEGYKALIPFSDRINDICGVRRSPATLRMYAHIWKMSSKLDLPKDILFSTCRSIVFSENPLKYSLMAKKGANRMEIQKAIFQDKNAR